MAFIKSLDDLIVYQKALQVSREISMILARESFRRDPRLRDQLGSSSERVASAISEHILRGKIANIGGNHAVARGQAAELLSSRGRG